MSGTEDLVNVERVGNKSKKTKLDVYTPSDPIKTTPELDSATTSDNFSEQRIQPPLSETRQGVTAVMAVMTGLNKSPSSNKKVSKKKTIRVLLDSGSDGDLLFHKKGKSKQFPYLPRQVPKTWHTSNGDFQTKGKGNIQLKFFQYSNSKRVHLQPDIVEYDLLLRTSALYIKDAGMSWMDVIGNSISSMVIIFCLKSKMIPNSSMV